jgi:hypothetical protein
MQDHIFSLHTLIKVFKEFEGNLYCVFIDVKKVFDSICNIAVRIKFYQTILVGNDVKV